LGEHSHAGAHAIGGACTKTVARCGSASVIGEVVASLVVLELELLFGFVLKHVQLSLTPLTVLSSARKVRGVDLLVGQVELPVVECDKS